MATISVAEYTEVSGTGSQSREGDKYIMAQNKMLQQWNKHLKDLGMLEQASDRNGVSALFWNINRSSKFARKL